MSSAETFLIEAMSRVLDGHEVTVEEIDAAITRPLELDRIEQGAWQVLRQWADDKDIRARDPHYAEARLGRLRDEMARLQGYSEEEIERGDHTATRISWWGCLILLAILVGTFAWLVG